MTHVGHAHHRRWTEEFSHELRLRQVSGEDINEAISTVDEHLNDSGESASDAFGNPRDYAASLGLSPTDDGPARGQVLVAAFVATLSFLAFGLAVSRWISGEGSSTVIICTLGAGAIMLSASALLTLGIAKQIVEATVRERFTGVSAGAWSRYAPAAIAVPWVFPIFAAVIVAVGVLRA
ncbi:hypothetical protein [Paeniglutamicibacter gangotriensis]|uniref:Uncharacterized protein n=1 Tax=Paeniglutamicibacter gangotriensis Lz1y TaxID=1276920 RepID=M7MR90_9MICC|nr:hypothetical protein [Paeniglutamicibacter gangotriensis]EMQ97455.1 hypothetical protein ADIAG_03250 [Paeniglutamicibacter gangotriensis Lz1y]